MPISYEFKTIFVHIPKNAGTSIEKYLGMAEADTLYAEQPLRELNISFEEDSFSPGELSNALSVSPQHLTASQLSKLLPPEVFQSFYKFSVIRHPYHRMLSEYFYVKGNRAKRFKPFQNMTFHSFLVKAFALSPEEQVEIFDNHLLTQKEFLTDTDGTLLVDELFSMETLDQCETKLKALSGLTIPLPRSRVATPKNISGMLTDEVKELIYNKFSVDFEYLNFQK